MESWTYLLFAIFSCAARASEGAANPCQNGCPNIPSSPHHTVGSVGDPTKIWPWQIYKSSAFEPPLLTITGPGGHLDPGYLFLTPSPETANPGVKQSLALIMDNDGELVYAFNASGSTDFRMQNYSGSHHLTLWTGNSTVGLNVGHGYGVVHFLDQQYNGFVFNPQLNINTLTPGSPGIVDLHEHQMTASGESMIVTAYNATPADLRAFGVKNGYVFDSLVADFDIKTGKLLFLWNPIDHGVTYNMSQLPLGIPNSGNGSEAAPWDWCHINSAEKVGDNYLINSRHLWTTWLVNGTTGDIIWTIEGHNGGDFGPLPEGATFSWQHYVRAQNVSKDAFIYSIFDNHNNEAYAKDSAPTTGLLLQLTLPPNKKNSPKVLRQLSVPAETFYVGSQGSYDPYLSNGNSFMGYGQISVLREYSPKVVNQTNQALLREWRFSANNVTQSYRGFKQPWKATPAKGAPNLVVEKNGSGPASLAAYVSWNGATEVAKYVVYGGPTKSNLTLLGQATRKGFETTFNVTSHDCSCVQVGAVQMGSLVRKSNIACV